MAEQKTRTNQTQMDEIQAAKLFQEVLNSPKNIHFKEVFNTLSNEHKAEVENCYISLLKKGDDKQSALYWLNQIIEPMLDKNLNSNQLTSLISLAWEINSKSKTQKTRSDNAFLKKNQATSKSYVPENEKYAYLAQRMQTNKGGEIDYLLKSLQTAYSKKFDESLSRLVSLHSQVGTSSPISHLAKIADEVFSKNLGNYGPAVIKEKLAR